MSATTAAMTREARRFKVRADSVLEDVFRALFEEIDTGRIRREVDTLRQSDPGIDEAAYARAMSRRAGIRAATAGAITGLPAGVGAIATTGFDLAFLVYQQLRLVVGIATIYGHEPSSRERFTEAMQCLAIASGIGVGKQGLAILLRDRVTRALPVIGAVSGGVLNYAAIQATGRTAVRYYESKVDNGVADEIWAEGDREHA